MEEIWKDVPGYNGLQASNLGQIRGPKCVRSTYLNNGYPSVHLRAAGGGKKLRRSVHRLILEAFVGPRPDGMECRHINGIKTDNRLENLAWGTPAENTDDNHKNRAYRYGERAPRAKLTPEKVIEIFKSDAPCGVLSKLYGITKGAVSSIKSRRNWYHLTASL